MTFATAPYTPLLNAVSANANGSDAVWPGGAGCFMVQATSYGGGTVKLQFKLPNGNYVDVGTDVTMTADGVGGFNLPQGTIRATLTGATSPSGLSAFVAPIPVNGG